jgi:hypothetical protein
VGRICTALLVAACGTPPTTPPENILPRARLIAPVAAKAGAAASFDASASFDSDGFVASYRFIFGDGSAAVETGNPLAQHVYDHTGSYEVQLLVRDDGGGEGRALQRVQVVDEPPSCADASRCGTAELCREGLCYRTGGGLCEVQGCVRVSCEFDADCGDGRVCRAGSCALP